MDSKPSRYNGKEFRSRTEARWAAFFDCLHLRYDFEPGYFTEAWGTYTPDFYIFRDDELEIGPFWIEVKGQTPSERERRKLRDVCNRVRCEGLLLVGWPEESGEMYYFSPWRDGRDYVIRQNWLDLLLGADRTSFSRARATFVEDSPTPLESPLLTVTEPCDLTEHPSLPPSTQSEVLELIAQGDAPDGKELSRSWRAQRRAIVTLWEANKRASLEANGLMLRIADLMSEIRGIKKLYSDLSHVNGKLYYIIYAMCFACLLATAMLLIFG